MRVFLDTNVLVSAFATRGLSADVLRVAAKAEVLITGDRDLLELQAEVARPRIVSPREFWEELRP